MENGGKRPNAGRKKGSKDIITRDEVQLLRPRVFALLNTILDDAEKLSKKKKKQRFDHNIILQSFKEVAPYVLRKQPQAIDGGEGKPIGVEVNVSEVVARIFGSGQGNAPTVSSEVDSGSIKIQDSE